MEAFLEVYNVHIQNVFEGPMDLLVYLIRKNDLDITDIPIAVITDQYREHVEMMQQLNIDNVGEFLVMAATLTQIKSRMLLPVLEGEEDAEDPRMEITRPITEYLAVKAIAGRLQDAPLLGDQVFSGCPGETDMQDPDREVAIDADLYDLVRAFQKIMDRLSASPTVRFKVERISIRERMKELSAGFRNQTGWDLEELLAGYSNRSDMIVTFLAVLELARLEMVRIYIHEQTGLVRLIGWR